MGRDDDGAAKRGQQGRDILDMFGDQVDHRARHQAVEGQQIPQQGSAGAANLEKAVFRAELLHGKIGLERLLAQFAVDQQADAQGVRVGDLAGGHQFRADGAEAVAALGLDGRAVVAVFGQAELVDDAVTRHVIHGVGRADATGVLADHHTQRRARLKALDAGGEHHLLVVVNK